jgi:hypothetical protein
MPPCDADTSWKRVSAGPKLSQAWGEVAASAVTSASNAWAAGMSATNSILRWNGTAWKKATSGALSALIMHWNVTSWTRQAV